MDKDIGYATAKHVGQGIQRMLLQMFPGHHASSQDKRALRRSLDASTVFKKPVTVGVLAAVGNDAALCPPQVSCATTRSPIYRARPVQ